MKTGEGKARDGIGRLYTYVTADELIGLLFDAGFTLQSRTDGRSEGLDGTQSDWVILLATRNG